MEKKTERRDWGEIKNAYITGKESLNKLAERYEIPLRTIKDRSRKENWVEERKKFRTGVAQEASRKTAKKEVKRLVKLRDVAEDVADLIGQDVERMKMIKDLTVALKNIADVMRDVYDIPTIREKLLQAKYNDYKRILAEMEKAPEDSLIVLAETLERVEEDDMEEMDKDGGGAAEGEEGNLEPTAEAD